METRPVIILALALSACAHTTTPDGANDSIGADEATEALPVEENLRRLSDLEVFEVGSLVLDVPDEAFSCYGPCPDWQDEIEAAEAEVAGRLQRFTDAAVAAAAVPNPNAACDEGAVYDDVASLSSLEVVEVWGLVTEQPANNPMCYNLPCAEDIAAAEEANCLRAQRLDAIVAATQDL